MNGIGGETWIFFLLHKMRDCCWEPKRGAGITAFLPQLNTREEQYGAIRVFFKSNFVSECGGGVVSLNMQVNLLLFE